MEVHVLSKLSSHVGRYLEGPDVGSMMLTCKALYEAFEWELRSADILHPDTEDLSWLLMRWSTKPDLRQLRIAWCSEEDDDPHLHPPMDLSSFSKLQSLEMIFDSPYTPQLLSFPTQLESLAFQTISTPPQDGLVFVSSLACLTRLELQFCDHVPNLYQPVAGLRQLRVIRSPGLHRCIPQLLHLTNLQELETCDRLLPVARDLSALTSLTRLSVKEHRSDNIRLEHDGIGALTSLQKLELVMYTFPSLQQILPLTNLTALWFPAGHLPTSPAHHRLSAAEFNKLALLTRLQRLYLSAPAHSLAPLAALTQLSYLGLQDTSLHRMQEIRPLHGLETVWLGQKKGDPAYRGDDLCFLEELPALRKLCLTCTVETYASLVLPPQIQLLALWLCTSLVQHAAEVLRVEVQDEVPARPGLTVTSYDCSSFLL